MTPRQWTPLGAALFNQRILVIAIVSSVLLEILGAFAIATVLVRRDWLGLLLWSFPVVGLGVGIRHNLKELKRARREAREIRWQRHDQSVWKNWRSKGV